MITNNFSEREKFYHIVLRVKQERKLSWREAWKITAKADRKINARTLFPTYLSFERFHIRYLKSEQMVVKNNGNEIKIEEMHDFCGISEGVYIQELLTADGVHVNQLNRNGRSWIDVEEAEREKHITVLLQEHERGKRTRANGRTIAAHPARKRKRARTLSDGISQRVAHRKSKKNARADNRYERAG